MTLPGFTLRAPDDDGDRKLLTDIETYGWHATHVPPDEHGPGFTFTTGFYYSYGQPELLIMGISRPASHRILSAAAREIRGGAVFKDGDFSETLLTDYRCRLSTIAVSQYCAHLGQAIWFYRHAAQAVPGAANHLARQGREVSG